MKSSTEARVLRHQLDVEQLVQSEYSTLLMRLRQILTSTSLTPFYANGDAVLAIDAFQQRDLYREMTRVAKGLPPTEKQ